MKCKKHHQLKCPQCFGRGEPVQSSSIGGDRVRAIAQAAGEFGLDPERALYVRTTAPEDVDPFLVSNEYDWPGLSAQHERLKAEVAICVGSNMGWDQALENDCSALVLLDHHRGVAQIHEWVFRPLMMISESPLAFLQALCCMPERAGDAEGFLRAHDKLSSVMSERVEQVHQHQLELLKRVEASAKAADISSVAQKNLSRYFAMICKSRGCEKCDGAGYPFELGHFAPRLTTARDLSSTLISHLSQRYLRDERLKICWLHSSELFLQLKAIFQHHLYYVVGDIFDPADRDLWTVLGETFRFTSWAINLSNVIDYVYSRTVGSRHAEGLKGVYKQVCEDYGKLSLRQLRLQKLLEIEALVSKVHPDLDTILFYYTVGLGGRGGHQPKDYIHMVGTPVGFGGLD